MISIEKNQVWFVTGSQHLYGPETLKQVAAHSEEIAKSLDAHNNIPVEIVYKGVVTTPEEITKICLESNNSEHCIGLVLWMHTFSPAKMWINGLKALNKPFLHLHTQYNAEIPWSTIDMDFMNLNQSAHGDREFGFICTRLGINRKVVVGHWQDERVVEQINVWTRVASAHHDAQHGKVARIGDNMREVAVTEGDKVEAQIKFGYSTNGYGVGDVVAHIESATDAQVKALIEEYEATYTLADAIQTGGAQRASLEDAARIEIGMRSFMTEGGFTAFTDTFENLYGMKQLPGIASQRLMADGYGFAGEGDWKTAALVRTMKVMAAGMKGGNSFMEDYTYHFSTNGDRVLGSHMLEICPSISGEKVKCEVHPLGIGGKEDPVRLVFDAAAGKALNASVVDMGGRMRMIVNNVEGTAPEQDLPHLPTARVLWDAKPNLEIAAQAWILAGGAHHTVYSQNLGNEYLEDYADMVDLEIVTIDENTNIRDFKNTLQHNNVYRQVK
ncbi:L-arabinose isomerase [Reichenbachiella sp. 5M10]|uniref:L-arabinose isomerase n=1 Tax=Reichenbachiella sp. 5M10 TaxID=1889772 RepID=UPI000C14CA41|nr:L-arabinose isomerase [Reichenbachiella sp. 5M10]PIB34706.1 L-arabinose isomerase [Reichenbachiella sp. 5M10]